VGITPINKLTLDEFRIRPVILCGGAGSRLWPLSRSLHPKQLLALQPAQTMLQATARRTESEEFLRPIIVTGEDHRFLVRDQLRAAAIDPAEIILEPAARNTAAAIALACYLEARTSPDQLMLVMPADHVIGDEDAFRRAVRSGVRSAEEGAIVTFGIRPTRAETGYGYIEAGNRKDDSQDVFSVVQFVEKPDAATAETYFQSGRHFWNGGIFLFKASTLIIELEAHAPEIANACEDALAGAKSDGAFLRPQRELFFTSPSISIDYAVMEKTGLASLVPVDMQWSDVGSWDALWEVSDRDGASNALSGDVVAVDTSGCLVRSESGATVATLGVNDLVIVATRDAVLVVPRERAQDLKTLVQALEMAGVDKQTLHPLVHRPWGTYETVDRGERFQTKRIVVRPGEKLSLQMHNHRSEHWIVVAGTARVTIGEEVRILQENESAYVPVGVVHRLENPGKIPLHLVEVQCGAYVGEDDIVRLDDDYGRLPEVA
jgi:mannose-1-phosphate guanylyltransferase/mannose-6-phosphate isomerase